jgi:hypothetical protein
MDIGHDEQIGLAEMLIDPARKNRLGKHMALPLTLFHFPLDQANAFPRLKTK